MIGPVHIRNYKSIRELDLEARRVNVFIGEPATGKSNIIEALAWFAPGTGQAASEILRCRTLADLFFDQKVSEGLSIKAGPWQISLKLNGNTGQFEATINEETQKPQSFLVSLQSVNWILPIKTSFRYYAFKPLANFPNRGPGVLNPPFGDNLPAILYTNETLRRKIGDLIREKGYRLQLKPTENELLISKDVGDEIYSYPWMTVSETLRRIAFFMAMLETNRDVALLLDEPETNTFPFYTKYLAERIALDDTNQFFITTHNPYLLSSVVEKTPKDNLAVFVTQLKNFETIVKTVPENKLSELLDLDADAFFNLDKLVEE